MTSRPLAPRVRRLTNARDGVIVVFALAGITFASFAARIPDVKAHLDLSAGELGMTLFAASLGSLTALPSAGRVTDRVGASRAVTLGMVAALAGLLVVGGAVDIASSRWLVAGGLFLVGLGVGVWDVAMNLEGAAVERGLRRTVMPHFHAAFSGGTVAAGLAGAAMSKAHAPLMLHFALVAAITVGGAAWALRSFLPRENEVDASARDRTTDTAPAGARDGGMDGGVGRRPVVVRPRSAWLEPRTIMIGLVVLSAAFAEGTANDWVAVAFVDGHGVPHWAGVLAFTTFLTFMTVGRLAGTRLLDRYGRVAVVRATFVAAAAGSLLVIFGNVWLAYLGTAVWGVGASLGFPVGMSASADDAGRAGARMSVVATIGYTAFIAGPPLLGLLGDHFTVLRALLVVTVLLTGAMFLVPSLRPERGPARIGLVR